MTGTRASNRTGLAAVAALAAGVVVLAVIGGRSGGRSPAAPAATGSMTSEAADREAPRVVAPVVTVDAQGALMKVSHQDPNGRIPLEYIETPEGTLTIRRTFDAGGRVLKEEAFRGEQRVPVPELVTTPSASAK